MLFAGWTLLFVLLVSFVCVAAEIGPVPGNSGSLASSGAICGCAEGEKRQKKCGMKTRLAPGDIHQQRDRNCNVYLVTLYRCDCHIEAQNTHTHTHNT